MAVGNMNPIADIDVLGEVALLAVEFVQFVGENLQVDGVVYQKTVNRGVANKAKVPAFAPALENTPAVAAKLCKQRISSCSLAGLSLLRS